jgi:hypothetical protein
VTEPIGLDAARNTESEPFEEWRPIPGYEGYYEASSLGRVRRVGLARGCRRGHILKAVIRKDRQWPYRQMRFSVNNIQTNAYTHRVVCEAFHGTAPFPGAEVRHLDGDSLNNCADNLTWGTSGQNERDKVIHGTHRFGKTHCINGHEFTPANTSYRPKGRVCRACKRASYHRNKRAA